MSVVEIAPPADCDEMRLGFGLVARIIRGERDRAAIKQAGPDEPPGCRCGAKTNPNDKLVRSFAGVSESYYYCSKCQAYYSPSSGRRYGNVVR